MALRIARSSSDMGCSSTVALAKVDYLCDSRPLMPERPRSIPVSPNPMHDIKSIRDDPQAFDEGLKRRGLAPMSAEILQADVELRAVLTRLQQAQARRNEASKLIGHAKAKKDEAQASALMAEVTGLKDAIQKGEDEERRLKEQL